MIKPDQRIGATYMCPVYYTFHSEEVNKAERTICQAKVKATLPNSEIISTVINCDACSSNRTHRPPWVLKKVARVVV